MTQKQIGMIMQAVAGIVSVGTLIAMVKWHPVMVGILVVSIVVGYLGNRLYRA